MENKNGFTTVKVKALVNSRKNRMFADALLRCIMVEMLLPEDGSELDPELELSSYRGVAKGNVDAEYIPIREKLSPKEIDGINTAIHEARLVNFRNATHLMEHCEYVFSLNDCQCVEAVNGIVWERPQYRHNQNINPNL